jgi:hypothetical protein
MVSVPLATCEALAAGEREPLALAVEEGEGAVETVRVPLATCEALVAGEAEPLPLGVSEGVWVGAWEGVAEGVPESVPDSVPLSVPDRVPDRVPVHVGEGVAVAETVALGDGWQVGGALNGAKAEAGTCSVIGATLETLPSTALHRVALFKLLMIDTTVRLMRSGTAERGHTTTLPITSSRAAAKLAQGAGSSLKKKLVVAPSTALGQPLKA